MEGFMRTKHVIVVPYNYEWSQNFIDIKNELDIILGNLALRIEHVGSTSVEVLSAKPIIDIDVVIKGYSFLKDVINKLDTIGYQYEGNLGIEGREAFSYTGKEHLLTHHLYVCTENSRELERHIRFREYLRHHPKIAKEYSRVKEEAARLFPNDIDKYIEYKSPLIEKIYANLNLV